MALPSTVQALTAAKRKFFYGWWIVLSTSTINLYFSGVYFYGLSAFFDPIRNDFKWSATVLSLPLALRSVETGLFAPVLGFFVDRYGARKIMVLGTLVSGLGAVWLSRVHSLGEFYAAMLFMALGVSASTGLVPVTALANWFHKKMGKAVGIQQVGVGLGGLLVPVVVWMIGAFEWRTALLIIGIGIWAVCLPVALLVRSRPEPYGWYPDGEPVPSSSDEEKIETGTRTADFRTGEAVKTRAFWVLAGVFTLGMFGFGAFLVHVMPSIEKSVFPGQPGKAGLVLTAMLLMSAVGRFAFGWLSDIWDKRMMLAVVFLLQSAGLVFFALADTVWMLIPFVVLFSLSLGGQGTVRAAILRDYFGSRSYGGIMGLMMVAITGPTLLAPPIAGWIFDTRGDYTLAWVVFALVAALAVPLVLTLKRPSRRSSRPGFSD